MQETFAAGMRRYQQFDMQHEIIQRKGILLGTGRQRILEHIPIILLTCAHEDLSPPDAIRQTVPLFWVPFSTFTLIAAFFGVFQFTLLIPCSIFCSTTNRWKR